MNVNIKLLNEHANLPRKASEYAAGYDVYASKNTIINPFERKLVPLGFAIETELNDIYFRIAPRSGLAVKGIDVAAGVCDVDYRGEYHVLLVNNTPNIFHVTMGDRIAQLIPEKIQPVVFQKINDFKLPSTERNNGGFGSTGV